MADIGGNTRLYPVLGYPVRQVRAPALINPMLARTGTDAVVVPVEVRPADLASVVAGLRAMRNVDGLLVTVPHKVAVAGMADRRSSRVEVCGSANVLRRDPDSGWSADMVDGLGFVAGLAAAGLEVRGRRTAVVGVGGAGVAIAAALLEAGVGELAVLDVDANRRTAVLERLRAFWPDQVSADADLKGVDLAVNATPLGLKPDDPLPFDPARLPPSAIVADIIMDPVRTPLLAAAEAAGRCTHRGEPTLRHQLDFYCRFFGWP